jgi:hypothetical protein
MSILFPRGARNRRLLSGKFRIQGGDFLFEGGPFAHGRQLLPLGFPVQALVIRPFSDGKIPRTTSGNCKWRIETCRATFHRQRPFLNGLSGP